MLLGGFPHRPSTVDALASQASSALPSPNQSAMPDTEQASRTATSSALVGLNGPKRKKRVWLWALVICASALFLVLGLVWSAPPPPKEITLATGGKTGAYFSFGKEYADALGKDGLRVKVVNTAGSDENIRLLLQGKADVAFVQGGVSPVEGQDVGAALGQKARDVTVGDALASIAAVYFEPLWVFYRGDQRVVLLSQLKGKKVAMGARGSGTLALARELLARNGVDATNADLHYLNSAKAADALIKGEVDAAMMVTSHRSQDVQKLVTAPGVHLMSFRRHVAYVRSVPYLDRIDLAQGILDLRTDSPPEDVVLLAPAATLVCRRGLHPTVVQRFLTVAKKLHGGRGLMNRAGRFPAADLADLPLHDAAETFFMSGMPATRWVPFWIVRLAFKLKILALPLITLLLPFAKLGSVLWVFRIKYLIRRHYQALRRIEADCEEATDGDRLRQALDALDLLRSHMAKVSRGVPDTYQDQIYHWRLHVTMVKDELEARLAQASKATHEPSP